MGLRLQTYRNGSPYLQCLTPPQRKCPQSRRLGGIAFCSARHPQNRRACPPPYPLIPLWASRFGSFAPLSWHIRSEIRVVALHQVPARFAFFQTAKPRQLALRAAHRTRKLRKAYPPAPAQSLRNPPARNRPQFPKPVPIRQCPSRHRSRLQCLLGCHERRKAPRRPKQALAPPRRQRQYFLRKSFRVQNLLGQIRRAGRQGKLRQIPKIRTQQPKSPNPQSPQSHGVYKRKLNRRHFFPPAGARANRLLLAP